MNPPMKKTAKWYSLPIIFSNVFPNTNRKSMFPKRWAGLAWRNRAVTKVHTLPANRLFQLNAKFVSMKVGSCCQAQKLRPTHPSMSR